MNFKLKPSHEKHYLSWEMKHFIALVKHDNGVLRLKLSAPSRDAAFCQIMLAEGCPKRAIKLYNYNPGGPEAGTSPKGMGKMKCNSL